MKRLIPLALVLSACACKSFVPDPSALAISNDYTLVSTLNEAMPGRGGDIIHVKSGSPISTVWKLVLPKDSSIQSGEVDVQYLDHSLQFAYQGPIVEVPLKELIGHDVWDKNDSGSAIAYVNIAAKTPSGVQVVKARGIALIVVTDSSYDPLPVDSGYEALGVDCHVSYTSAGRSSVKCK